MYGKNTNYTCTALQPINTASTSGTPFCLANLKPEANLRIDIRWKFEQFCTSLVSCKLAFPSALRCLEFQQFWAWEHRIGEYSSPKGRFVINNYRIVASANGIDNCRPHCIAYMANYITTH